MSTSNTAGGSSSQDRPSSKNRKDKRPEVSETSMTVEMEDDATEEFWRDANDEWESCVSDWKTNFQLDLDFAQYLEAEREKLLVDLEKDCDRAKFRSLQYKLLDNTFQQLARKDV